MLDEQTFRKVCTRIGLRPAEFNCTAEGIPEPIALALEGPISALKESSQGFGLVGDPGIGKTASLAVRVKKAVENFGSEWPPIKWVYWPEQAEVIKSWSSSNQYHQIEFWFESAKEVPFLFLDDIGRERRRSDNDLSLGVLDRLVSSRSRDLLPIVWTSNASVRELVEIYGGPFTSRLFGIARPIILPKLPDLRIKRPS